MSSPYLSHVKRWNNCKGCDLHKKRNRVVPAKGTIPCDVLFVGEAPGKSEDVLGLPFVGPAGKLLDSIIFKSKEISEVFFSYAMTNVIACIPKDDDGNKVTEPPKAAIKACRPRVAAMIELCKPKIIVAVGKVAVAEMALQNTKNIELISLTHPAAILRADVSQQGLAIQRATITLADALLIIVPQKRKK